MLFEENVSNFEENVLERIRTYITSKRTYKHRNTGSVYVLLLDGKKLYVGFSKNYQGRTNAHLEEPQVSFLKKHKPIKLLTSIGESPKSLETELTKWLMIYFGVNNVRGGPYTKNDDYNVQPRSMKNFRLTSYRKKEPAQNSNLRFNFNLSDRNR